MSHTRITILAAALTMCGLLSAQSVTAAGFAVVTDNGDSGLGTLRQALEIDGATEIFIAPEVGDIEIFDSLTYNGPDPLTIWGSGQTVRTDLNINLLEVLSGANLAVAHVNFSGPGGWSIQHRGDLGTEAGKGIFLKVNTSQTGVVELNLESVSVSGVANHGIHVSDCDLADECGGGSGGGGDGSPASIIAAFRDVSISDVGNGKFDADGFRVDERGPGDIIFTAAGFSADGVGADGTELDEGDDGDVRTSITNAAFTNNGNYCDPAILEPFLPDEVEGEFDESEQVIEDQIPPEVTGSPDDSCFEREVDFYEGGFVEAYEFGIDLDDGIDIDEAGAGSLISSLNDSLIQGNLDEGVDFDEEQAGDVVVRFVGSTGKMNRDDGFKVSEEDDGDLSAVVLGVQSKSNGGKGIVLEEADDGTFTGIVRDTVTANNDDKDDTGIEAVQEDNPVGGTLEVRNSSITDGIDADGVEQI